MIKEQDALLTSNIEKSKVSQEPPQLLMNQSDIHFMKNQLKNECKNEQLINQIFDIIELQQEQVAKVDKQIIKQQDHLKDRYRHFSFGIKQDIEAFKGQEGDVKVNEIKQKIHQMKRKSKGGLQIVPEARESFDLQEEDTKQSLLVVTPEAIDVKGEKTSLSVNKPMGSITKSNDEKPEVYDKLYNYDVRVKSSFGNKKPEETIIGSIEESQVLTLSAINSKRQEINNLLIELIQNSDNNEVSVSKLTMLRYDMDTIFNNLSLMTSNKVSPRKISTNEVTKDHSKEMQKVIEGQNVILKTVEKQNKQLIDLLKRAKNRYLSKELTTEESNKKVDDLLISLVTVRDQYKKMFDECKSVLEDK